MVEKELCVDSVNTPIFGIDLNGCVNEVSIDWSVPSILVIWIWDANYWIHQWNYKTAELTGFTPEEAYYQPFVDTFVVTSVQESVRHVISKALEGFETSNFKLSFMTKDSKQIYLLVNASTRRDIEDNIVGGKIMNYSRGCFSLWNKINILIPCWINFWLLLIHSCNCWTRRHWNHS